MNTQRNDLEAQIIEHAWQDPAFKAELLANPRWALETFFHTQLPPGLTISVVEETPAHLYLVLPHQPLPASTELNEADLALVGGGRTYRPAAYSACEDAFDCHKKKDLPPEEPPLRRTSC